MDRVILYENRKSDPLVLDVSTPEKRTAAFLCLFRVLDEEWQVYSELNKREQTLYDKARGGDGSAAERLLSLRKDNEYEMWQFVTVVDPKAV